MTKCRKPLSPHVDESKVHFDRTVISSSGTIYERCYAIDSTDGEKYHFGDIELFYGPYCKEGFVSFNPSDTVCMMEITTIEQILNRMKEIEKERVAR